MDATMLNVRWGSVSKEGFICFVEITKKGYKEFFDFDINHQNYVKTIKK